MKALIVAAACIGLVLLGCSSSDDSGSGGKGGAGGGTNGGTGGTGGGSTAGAGGGATCTTVTGTYLLVGVRDTSAPGSCPNTLNYADAATATLTKNGSNYALAFGATLSGSGCSVNVTGCALSATCTMLGQLAGTPVWDSSWQGEIAWTISDKGAGGTDHWTNFMSNSQTTKCSANWIVTATRQ
jgi:hypothetical protein